MIPYYEQVWKNQEIVISTQSGLEPIVAEELKEMGFPIIATQNRAVITRGNTRDLITLNMSLRSALSVAIPIRTFSASSYDMLYFRTKKIHWHKLFDVHHTIRIDVRGSSHHLNNSQYVIHRIKDAIMDTFRKFHDGKRPSIDKKNPDIHIIVYLKGKEVTLLLDSSGTPLFQRGYRKEHGLAPLKEDLAAALAYLINWNAQTPVLDPFCGSGTILIEAYLKKRNIPPNLFREFSLFHWKNFDSRLVQQVRTDLIQHIQSFDGKPFIGIEKDTPTFQIASEILKNLDIRNEINLINKPFEKVTQNFSGYTILTNPPYGQRVGDLKSQEQLFLNFHKFLDRQGPFRQVGVLHPSLEKFSFFKGRIKKAVELFNGPIPTKFYILNG